MLGCKRDFRLIDAAMTRFLFADYILNCNSDCLQFHQLISLNSDFAFFSLMSQQNVS